MPLDPAARAQLDQMAAMGGPPLNTLPAPAVREAMKAGYAAVPAGPDMHRVEDMELPGPEGPIPVRLYWPVEGESLPILVWYHLGGWVIGDIEGSDPTARRLADGAGCIVVSVDYRLAPEHPYPAAADDAYAAFVWCVQNAERIGGDATKIAVGGDSAGGNLAAVVSQMARDRGSSSGLVHQLLVYPVTDYVMTQDSWTENAEYLLTRELMDWFWDAYVPDAATRAEPYASPVCASDLSGLPPAHVITAEYDPLRDEGVAYAEALSAAGVPVVARTYEGQIHAFLNDAHLYELGREATATACEELRKAFDA